MRRSGFRLLPLGLAVSVCAAVLVASAPTAKACSQPAAPYVSTFGPFNRVPGNLVFFRLNDHYSGPPTALTLMDVESGEAVPTHDFFVGEDHVFAPLEPIAPGRHLVLLSSAEQRDSTHYEFSTTEHVELSLRPVELREIDNDGVNATLEYTLPEELAKIQHLLTVQKTVDGARYASWSDTGNRLVVRTSCEGTITEDSCGGVYSWSPGRHEAVVTAHLFGLPVQPEPARLSFETTCAQGCSLAQGPSDRATLLFMALVGVLLARGRRRSH